MGTRFSGRKRIRIGNFGQVEQLSTLHSYRLWRYLEGLPNLAPGESVNLCWCTQTNTGLKTIAVIQFPKKSYFSGETDIDIMISI